MGEIVGILILAIFLILPMGLTITDFIFFAAKKENGIFEFIAFFIGSIFMMIAYDFWALPDYTVALNKFGDPSAHEPVNSEHIMTIMILMTFGFVCYMILKFLRKKLPPLVEVILLGGVYLGSIINIVGVFQLICGPHPQGMPFPGSEYLYIFCICSVPVLFLMHVADLMVRLIKEKAEKQKSIHYDNSTMQNINLWFLKGANLFLAAVVALIPLFVIIMMILCLFGQQPDSVVLAFTKTSDWVLSQEVSPPPVEYDEHYLCTVSLRGHKKVVKPIRCGIRKGRKIIVNRQLCIANAFEQLLMERTPRLHRTIRNLYDTYGYPISRHINHAWSADITYFIMKPLEWIFVVILYLFDKDPETRICRQYLPLDN